MINEKEKASGEIHISSRQEMNIKGVLEIISFDSEGVHLQSCDGELFVEGESLKVGTFDTACGSVSLFGKIDAIYYASDTAKKKRSFFGKAR